METHLSSQNKNQRKLKLFIGISGAIILLCAGLTWIFLAQINAAGLPKAITLRANFPVYYYPEGMPTGMKLKPGSTRYENGILFFTLVGDRSEEVIVSEQPLPKEYQASVVKGGEAVQGIDGSATVSVNGERTNGYYISGDKKTFIIMNGTLTEISTIKDLIRYLKVIQP